MIRIWMWLAAAITVFAFAGALWALRESDLQREQSCRATLVSLQASVENAEAGIRPVVPVSLLQGFPPEQRAFALQQRQATIEENHRRRETIATTRAAIRDLQSSSFCS